MSVVLLEESQDSHELVIQSRAIDEAINERSNEMVFVSKNVKQNAANKGEEEEGPLQCTRCALRNPSF